MKLPLLVFLAALLVVPVPARAEEPLPELPRVPPAASPASDEGTGTAPAFVDDEPPPPRSVDVSPASASVHARTEASTGFQLHFGAGYTKPFGALSRSGGTLDDLTPGQLMVLDLGVGAKLGHFFYIGAYLAAGGGAGPAGCLRCSSGSAHLGLEAELSFRPSAKWNPWVGYGFGADSLVADTGQDEKVSYAGFEFARLTAGADARLTHAFGVGPYVGLSLGRYSEKRVTTDAGETPITISDTAVHGTFSLGVRIVLFP